MLRDRIRFRHAAFIAAFLVVSTAHAGPQGSGIELHVTLGTDLEPGACGSDTQLDVTRLDQVNLCYTVTNHSGTTLAWHTLADDVTGTLLSAVPFGLSPGETHQYNRIITARDSQAPVSTWTSYDVHPGYAFTANTTANDRVFADGWDGAVDNSPAYDFVDITAIGTPLNLDNDDLSGSADIGFPFTYYGLTAEQLRVAYNGGILFDMDAVFFTSQNVPLPAAGLGAAILPYWTDIYYQQPEDGNIYTATIGSAPNRRFVAEWFNLPIMIGGIQQDSATFEAILYEGSNRILFQYADTNVGDPERDDGITATIGLNAPLGVDAAIQYSYRSASVGAGKTILFEPTTPVTYSANQQVTLAVGVPKITVSPAQFNVSANAGGSTSSTLVIGNIGNRMLTWNVGSFASNAHLPPVSRFTLPFGDPSKTSAAPPPHSPKTAALRTKSTLVDGISAFAIDLDSSSLVSLNAAQPDAIDAVGSVGDLILTAGDFVDEDFTTLYAIDYYTYHLLGLNTRSGEISLIGTADLQSGAGINWTGMAWDASTGTLYGTAYGQDRDGLQAFLYRIDPVTAATTLVGHITGVDVAGSGALVSDIAVDANGLMYGIELVGDTFVAIDKNTGAASVISSLGFDANFTQGLDFDDYTGTLYYAAWNNSDGLAEMYSIDPASGDLTLVSPISVDPTSTELAALGIARLGGICAYPNEVPWLQFGETRGSTTAGDSTPIDVTFDASGLAPGLHRATVCVANNDLTNRRVPVTVNFTVN